MSDRLRLQTDFPVNPLDHACGDTIEYRRRMILGVLESYNSNYDVLAELLQNAVDAVEDAAVAECPGPHSIEVRIDLANNWLSVLDTGIGMSRTELCSAFAPSVSHKATSGSAQARQRIAPHRGYKGVGLTFLAYGTDDITIHTKSKDSNELIKARMQYGRKWTTGQRTQHAMLVDDTQDSPLDERARGTYVKIQLSPSTRPKSLSHLAADPDTWATILRTRTALGQVLLGVTPVVKIKVVIHVVPSGGTPVKRNLEAAFLLPHLITREPAFRFLDLVNYYDKHGERTEPPPDKLRQDGLHMVWNTDRIKSELTQDAQEKFAAELDSYKPTLYAFLPYQSSVWSELNQIATGHKKRSHLTPGLVIAVNRQRLADVFELRPSRFETLSRNILVMVHFENAKPDQGRKSVQDEVLTLANRIADRAVQYLAKQRGLLRPAGESPTPEQRQVEKDHSDWEFNVRTHAQTKPLDVPPLAYVSEPLTEQDVVGLFHQMAVLGLFPGIRVYATSQSKTYDCLVEFNAESTERGLAYQGPDNNPLGLSPYVCGDSKDYSTRLLTLEFKNNLDGLIDDLDSEGRKSFAHIDILACWSVVSTNFEGYSLEEIGPNNLDQREYPGVTHLLHKDGETKTIQVIMLDRILQLIRSGAIEIGHIGR